MMQRDQIDRQTTQAWKGIMKHKLNEIRRMRHRARIVQASTTMAIALCRAAELTSLAPTQDPSDRTGESP